MNRKKTQIKSEEKIVINHVQNIGHLVRGNLLVTMTVTIVGSLLLVGTSTWNIWSIYNSFQSNVTKQFELEKLASTLLHDDEVFTASTLLSAYSGDLKWEQQYRKLLPISTESQNQLIKKSSSTIRKEAENVGISADKLFAIEDKAFKLVHEGKQKEALALITGVEYQNEKKVFSADNDRVLNQVQQSVNTELANYQHQLLASIIFALSTLPLLLAGWILVFAAVRDYIQDRQTAQAALQQSQKSLLSLNEALQTESLVRKQQEERMRSDSQLLQQDIGALLDVVSQIESGDFTVQATVNNRATGLVGDTLNRLVETLGNVLSRVSGGIQWLAIDSRTQDKIAAAVAHSTSKQTQSMDRMLALTETVRLSANTAASQLQDTNLSLTMLQTAVCDGETTVELLNREIEILQQGSDRIVQQMKTLGEFVGLADRFVLDQSDIATQTQILALNASLVAARAAEQRDPKEFESVAREFESIASQVSQLAQQTNEGLNTLEQQNTQIHKVVSNVDGEVQQLGSLVNSFNYGVKQTREVFDTVQTVTRKVVVAGEVVAHTSQLIIESVDSTAKSIAEMAKLAAKIDQKSQSARSISAQMSNLSTELLENIQIFKLSDQPSASTNLISQVEAEGESLEIDYQLN